ncbi:PilZ domain-containing protein [Corallincola spongiicola]|uniref:PilZ domain-containing protein n=2 Tax=Corallincola spongiicola TaxID=2520508 RepID=A0ABY1WQ67_9GAMM|nr:PilZ domain-containing protein [Corallincola spongiicola]
MSQMSESSILESEELSFLNEVMFSRLPEGNQVQPSFTLDGDQEHSEMLGRLGQAASMQMVAQFKNRRLIFPLQLFQDEFNRLTMELQAPQIFETGPTMRQWRMQPQLPLRLLEACGKEAELKVHDISLSGFSVTLPEHEGPAPEKLELQLELPECGSLLPLSGAKVRRIDQQTVAYNLLFDEPDLEQALGRFLFEQHKQQHPEWEMPDVTPKSSEMAESA